MIQLSTKFVGLIDMPENFAMSFTLQFNGIISGQGSILQISKDNTSSSFIPAIRAVSTQLVILINQDTVTAPAITIGVVTKVTINVVGQDLMVYYNTSASTTYKAQAVSFVQVIFGYLIHGFQLQMQRWAVLT